MAARRYWDFQYFHVAGGEVRWHKLRLHEGCMLNLVSLVGHPDSGPHIGHNFFQVGQPHFIAHIHYMGVNAERPRQILFTRIPWYSTETYIGTHEGKHWCIIILIAPRPPLYPPPPLRKAPPPLPPTVVPIQIVQGVVVPPPMADDA